VLGTALVHGQSFNHGTRAALAARFGPQTFWPLLTPPMRTTGASRLVHASPYGPLSAPLATLNRISNYAIAPTALFGLHDRAPSLLHPSTLLPTAIPLDPSLPTSSWINALSFDLLRNRLLVSTFDGIGYLYAWDVATARWSVVNHLNRADLGAICYHLVHDATFGLEVGVFGGGPFHLHRYDATGSVLASTTLGLWTWGGTVDTFQMFMLGPHVAIVGPALSLLGAPVRHVLVVDPANGDIVFATYWIG
jgi:hypothetical protein